MSFQGVGPVLFGTPSMVTATLGVNDPEVGTRATWNGGEYLFVFNGGGSTISQYYGAVLQAAATNYSCTVSSTTITDVFMGSAQHADIPTLNYGWLLTRGFGTIKMHADNSAAVGARLCTGGNGGWGRVGSANTDTAYGTAQAVVMSAVASGASAGAWIKAFG